MSRPEVLALEEREGLNGKVAAPEVPEAPLTAWTRQGHDSAAPAIDPVSATPDRTYIASEVRGAIPGSSTKARQQQSVVIECGEISAPSELV